MTIKDAVRTILDAGGTVDIGKVSICDISVYLQNRERFENRYQVHSDDDRLRFSDIFVKQHVAIDKFVGIIGYLNASGN